MTSRGSLALATAALLSIAPAARAQGDFQGVITARIGGEETTRDAKFYVKGDKVRMEMEAPNGNGTFAMITDGAAHKSYMLMAQRQMYIETDIDTTGMPAMANQPARPRPELTWTGKKETIAGMQCEDATSKDADGDVYDLCIVRGMSFFMGRGGGRGMGRGMGAGGGRGAGGPGAGGEWQRGVQGQGFPLRVQKRGAAQPTFLVTSIEKKSLADDQFTPPSGWQKMSFPMGGMGGGRP